MFNLDQQISILYPSTTHVEAILKAKRIPRNVVVKEVRDLVRDPLTTQEFLRRPFVNRSRWLIRGFEPSFSRFRQFYLGSSVEFRSPGTLRLSVYDPDTDTRRIIGREFQPTLSDRLQMIRLVKEWENTDHGDFVLNIVPYDLRLIG
jgi:hypothetical protein